MKHLLSILTAMLLFAEPTNCQAEKSSQPPNKGSQKGGVGGGKPQSSKGLAGKGGDAAAHGESSKLGKGKKYDPTNRKAATPAMNKYVSSTVAIRPRRLAPGASGEISLVLIFHRTGLIKGSAPMSLKYGSRQGPFSLGDWSIAEPKPSSYYPQFDSIPVYDDTATITVPITVGPDTKHGRYQIHFELESPLADGESGKELGLHKMVCAGVIEVGDPLPVVRLPGARTTKTPQDSNAPIKSNPTSAGKPPEPDPSQPKATGNQAEPPSDSTERDTAEADFSEPPIDDSNTGLLIFGGVTLIALLALFLGRNKS